MGGYHLIEITHPRTRPLPPYPYESLPFSLLPKILFSTISTHVNDLVNIYIQTLV
jgi:hypothetical protein